ncbi:hypothetical protein [Aquimarina aggregata]|uniref:hypothetical protein n=1 Tax=Aquimarina aggregata TaxID=1642818 RepID=UPI002493250E|nr:hypothetical protein [Aquimarina aggregata]
MKLTIAYNKEKNGIELMFVPKLSDNILENYLIDLGFKKSNSKGGMWYVTDRPSYNNYVKKLQEAFKNNIDPKTIKVGPSYDVDRNHIDHYQFSLVNIRTDENKDEDKGVDYVIFDDLKKTATDIATRFANEKYGSRLNSVSVSPRNFKGRARNAFDEGRIITGVSKAKETDTDIDLKKSEEKLLEKIQIPIPKDTINEELNLKEVVAHKETPEVEAKDSEENTIWSVPESLTNENGVYTKETAKGNYEELSIPFAKTIKFEATIALVQNEEDQYLYGLSVTNSLSGWSGYSFSPSKGDNTYPIKEKALETAILQILDGVQYDHTEALRMGASEALKKAYTKTILAIYDFADTNKIKLPEEKSKAVLPLSIDEEESKKKEHDNGKTLNTLNEDVEQLIDELRELETDVDDKGVAFNIGNAKIELDEALKNAQGKQLIDELKKLHSNLLKITYTIPKGKFRNRWFAISEKLGSRIGIESFGNGKNFAFTIIQKHTTIDDALLAEFQSFIELHSQALHISYLKSKKDDSLSILKVRISSDRDTISFLHRRENNTIKIDGLNPLNEGMVSYNGGAVPMGKLKKAIKYMLANPQTLIIKPAEVYRLSDYSGAISTNVLHNGIEIPNVLLPEGVSNALDFNDLKEKDSKTLQRKLPKLFTITDKTLIYTIPSQLFILSQFYYPKDKGISVGDKVLQSHWDLYGESLFELLGYPTDKRYLYVNVNLGYYEVSTLEEIIGDQTKVWLFAIRDYRPIADLQVGLKILDDKIEAFQEGIEELKEPGALEDFSVKESDATIKSYSATIERYEEQRKKIQYYLDTYGNPHGKEKDQEDADVSVAEVSKSIVPDTKVYVADITNYKTFTPNVLIPKGVIAPFDSGSLKVREAKKIQEIASYLLKASDANLSELSAKMLFELSQMPHPNDYGFSVNRSVLLREWERRGQSLLEELGFPTDLEYPYVNIHTGYKSVSPLGNLIDIERNGNQWWSVVEHNRPIADMQSALAFIDSEVKNLTKVRDTFTNPKTGKPKSKKQDKEQYRSLTWDIESFEGSKQVIQDYLDLKKEGSTTNQNQDTIQEVVETETTEEKPQDHFSNIIVPERVIAPFDKGDIPPEVALQLKEQFFYLFEYTYRNVHWASPIELFMLLQFTNLKKSDISVKKETLYRIWEKEGQSLFNQLAYPTDPKHPYISLENGFFEVLPLEVIISSLPDVTIWWSAVKYYRPIANVAKALTAILQEQDILVQEREGYVDTTSKIYKGDGDKLRDLSDRIDRLEHSRTNLENYIASVETTPKEESDLKGQELNKEDYLLIPIEKSEDIRRQFKAKGFYGSFTGKEAFTQSVSVLELGLRWGNNQVKLGEITEKEFNKWIKILEKEIKKFEGKEDRESRQSKVFRLERIAVLKKESEDLSVLVEREDIVFRDELFLEIGVRAKALGYVISGSDIADFRGYMMKNLFEGRIVENYPDQSIGKTVRILIDDYFSVTKDKAAIESSSTVDYLDKVVAIMHDHYMEARRLSRKKIEDLKATAGVPNLGMLWEAVELSWLLWYKMLYKQPHSFYYRLQSMIAFWNTVQPTYAYSDSSKEQYKQYSTSCPISAMIAEYTDMASAASTFEPSAGNGLLVLGADPSKTHVNEIDSSRRKSLEFQGFKTITHLNAAEPFPEEYTKSFDVVVTNPPFDRWSADKFDKSRMVNKYFDGNVGLHNHLRLEHLMSGLALHTMKDSGKAALIIKGHIKFRDDDGYMATYKPFFNWLYSRYVVDDVINMNAYKLYNKQGAVTEMMLILINGRKPKKSKKVAPNRDQASSLANIADSFEELWERISSHVKTPLEIELEKLKIALGYDIF